MKDNNLANSKQSSLKGNIILNTFYELLVVIAPFVTTPYVSRILTSSGVGIYSYTKSIVTYFTILAALGTITYGKNIIAKHRDEKRQYSKIFWEIELLSIITSTICLSIWAVVVFFYSEYQIYLLILSLNIVSVIFDISWLYSGLEKYKYSISINSIFRIIGIICIFLFVNDANDVEIYVFIQCSTTLFGNISMWIFLPKVVSRVKIEVKSIIFHFKNTLIYFVPTIATTIYMVMDKTMIGLIVNDTSVSGCYEQATKIIRIIEIATFSGFNGVTGSRASYLVAKNEQNKFNVLFSKNFHIMSFLTIGAFFGLICVANTFIPLFLGDGYESTIYLIYILAPLIFIMSISNILDRLYYIPNSKRRQSNKYLIIGSIINFVLNLCLIPVLSSYGAALSSVISEVIIAFLYVKFSNNTLNFKNLFIILWKKFFAGLVMFVICLGINIVLKNHLESYWILSLQIISGFVAYVFVLFLLRDESINIVLNTIKNKIKNKKV